MNSVYLYPICFFLFICAIKKKRKKPVLLVITILYLLAAIAASIMINMYDYKFFPQSYTSAIYHILLMLMLLWPLRKIDRIADSPINDVAGNSLGILTCIVVFCCLVSIFCDIPYINLQQIAVDVSGIRTDMVEGNIGYVPPMLRYPYYIGSCYWEVALGLAFYNMVRYPQRWFLIILLLFCSLSNVVYGFTIASRDCLLVYVFVLFMLFILCRKDLPQTWKNFVRLTIIVCGLIAAILLVVITFYRFFLFSDQDRQIAGTIGYLGQGMVYFCERFEKFPDGLTGGAMHFPIFVGKSISRFGVSDTLGTDVNLNVFSTTIGSWVCDVGVYMTVIVTIIFSSLIKKVISFRKSPFTIIYYVWIFRFIFYGLFYFVDTFNGTKLFIYLFIILWDALSRNKCKPNEANSIYC